MKPLPKPPVYDITIPDDLPPLDGTLTRRARVEIALDVIATLKSRQRKLRLSSVYFAPFDYKALPKTGQLHTSRLPPCEVCARGMLFLKTVDRFDQCSAANHIASLVIPHTRDQWGDEQILLVESAFEGSVYWIAEKYYDAVREFRAAQKTCEDNRKPLMIAICQNIVDNHGEFKP